MLALMSTSPEELSRMVPWMVYFDWEKAGIVMSKGKRRNRCMR